MSQPTVSTVKSNIVEAAKRGAAVAEAARAEAAAIAAEREQARTQGAPANG